MNVGPNHDGRIMPIFEERLLQMGKQWYRQPYIIYYIACVYAWAVWEEAIVYAHAMEVVVHTFKVEEKVNRSCNCKQSWCFTFVWEPTRESAERQIEFL